MAVRIRPESALLRSPLLVTESSDAFEQICNAFSEEIKPHGFIVRLHVADVAYLTWEILRYRRSKAAFINLAFREALENLLAKLLRQPGEYAYQRKDEANELALGWFTDQHGKQQVLQLLKKFHLDESAIEAEAMRNSAAGFETFEKILASLESRRSRLLRFITEYHTGFGQQLRQASNRLIDGKAIALERDGSEKPKAA